MEQLEEQNRRLTDELAQIKERMEQMMELIRVGGNRGNEPENIPQEEEEREEIPAPPPTRTAVLIQPPEVSKQQVTALEERLRAVEGHNFDIKEAAEMCLVRDIQFPPKFKVPDFPKYAGMTCPRGHLTMYCRKMAAHADNEKLLIHCFQDSLSDSALAWYMHLEPSQVQTWKQLADAFLRRYKYNMDITPDRSDLQTLSKHKEESFKTYAQRWRELAAQVEPPLSDKETASIFLNSLTGVYYDKMIGNTSTLFADIVAIGERVEQGLKSGKITTATSSSTFKKPLGKKKEEGVNAISVSVPPTSAASRPRWSEKKLDPIPTTYGNLLPQLLEAKLVTQQPPMKALEAPYPFWYRPNEKCAYHSDTIGHSVENCRSLKYKVQQLIDAGWLTFDQATPNVNTRPLPKQE